MAASLNSILGYNIIIALLLLFVSTVPYVATSLNVNSTVCIEEERVALLKIRKDLKDPTNSLSSWIGKHCCDWKGVHCDNLTGHVVKLDLRWYSLSSELNPSLADMKYLTHLDLSYDDFQGNPIPNFIGSLTMLRYLDLSHANFSGTVPPHLGNLSYLQYLDISSSRLDSLRVRDLSWLSGLSSLQYLNMDDVNMTHKSNELFRALNRIPSLLELHLSCCDLRTLPPSLPLENVTSLSVLDLSGNHFNSIVPSWLFNMSTLTELQLSDSSLRGPLPKIRRENLCKLQNLDLTGNYDLTGDIGGMVEGLSCSNLSLMWLGLSSNQLTGKLPNSLAKFKNLFDLDLSFNLLSGPIPTSIGNLSNLHSLYLQGNKMGGTIPETIGKLTKLSYINLLENFWEGTMTNIHFSNLTNLITFSISSKNNSLTLKLTNDWHPPFKRLFRVEIRDCQVGPTFPNWLRNQMSLEHVILKNVGISEEIPYWVYNLSSQIEVLDLSYNKICGYLPKAMNFSSSNHPSVYLNFNQLKGSIPLWSGLYNLYLRNNLLSGTIPVNIGKEMPHLTELDLSNNYLAGSIPLSINMMQDLNYIDLSNNYLTGEIPVFWMGLQELEIIDLSNNRFSGAIPTSICSLPLLILDLSHNNLSENFSSTFKNCTTLMTLFLRNNKLFGSIPKAMSKSNPWLVELQLRGNALTGNIPDNLCDLPRLHLLDLAENKISGSVPACLGNMFGFKVLQTSYAKDLSFDPAGFSPYKRHIELVLNGREMEYWDQMAVHSTIDLSSNHLSGDIPDNLTELLHLGVLNLSWNHLTGNIPTNIGSLRDLESLDFSHNQLSGPIPTSMTSMTFLSHLNLSYNNLSGRIPVSNQFATFSDPSIYVGNPGLYRDPLPINPSSSSPSDANKDDTHEDKTERLWLYVSIALGYITGFWIVCGSLVLKRSWRLAYFKFMEDTRDNILIFIAVNLARAKRKLGLERI